MKEQDEFDKFFGLVFKFGIAGAIISALVSLAVLGVAIWAVIALVLHFT